MTSVWLKLFHNQSIHIPPLLLHYIFYIIVFFFYHFLKIIAKIVQHKYILGLIYFLHLDIYNLKLACQTIIHTHEKLT